MAKNSIINPWLDKGRKLLRDGGKLSFRSRPSLTALDVDGQMLRVVQTVQRGGRQRVIRFVARELEVPAGKDISDAAVLGAAIAKALRGLDLKPGPIVMGLPRALAVLRTLSIPAAPSQGELASMVHFQVSKDLPFPVAEAVIDWKVQGQHIAHPVAVAEAKPEKAGAAAETGKADSAAPAGARVDILVAAVRREVVQFYQKAADAAGLKLAALGLRSYANARCVQACNLIKPGEYVALVSLRLDEVIIDVFDEETLVFSRGTSVRKPEETAETPEDHAASEESHAAETDEGSTTGFFKESGFADSVTIEVVRSLHGFEGTAVRGPVAQVVVAGGTGQEQAVVDSLQKRLNIPCSFLDPAGALGLPESERAHSPGALAAFGLGLGANDPSGLPFDFLNPKQPAPPPNHGRIRGIAAAAGIMVLLVILLGIRHRLMGQHMAKQKVVAAQVAKEQKNSKLYRQLRLQAKVVGDWEKARQPWLDHYAYLSTILPPSEELYLNSLAISPRGTIRLSVQARSGEIIAKLDKLLRAAGYNINPLAINPSPDKHGYLFKSSVELDLPGNLVIDFPPGNLAAQKAKAAQASASSSKKPKSARPAPGSKTAPPATTATNSALNAP